MADTARRKPPNAGKGRPKGSPNKLTRDVKEMILAALNKAGGEAYLVRQSEANPTAFLTLVGKVLPLSIGGDKDNPLRSVHEIRLVAGEFRADHPATAETRSRL